MRASAVRAGATHNHGVTPAARAMPRRVGRPRLMATIHVRTWISFRDTGCHVAPSISKGESGIGLSSWGGVRRVIVVGRDPAAPLGDETSGDERGRRDQCSYC